MDYEKTVIVLPPQRIEGFAGYNWFDCEILGSLPGAMFTFVALFILSLIVYAVFKLIFKKTTVRFFKVTIIIFLLIEIFYLLAGYFWGIRLFPFPHPFACI
ncbi:hypothetical protein HYW54_00805 [Candidatus Gottesmanbacteria bacterium]|nr:hypothetical protein [Candidatus Gottesmanbacteria bacterium]